MCFEQILTYKNWKQIANTLIVQLLNWAMDALRWIQVLNFGLGKHNYQITDETFHSFGKVRSLQVQFLSNITLAYT
jgi:hypothetical protein